MTRIICTNCGNRVYSEGAHCESCGSTIRINLPDNLPTIGEQMENELNRTQQAQAGSVPPHVMRMQIEAHELDKKGMALSMFINTNPLFKTMSEEDQGLMMQQQYHMGAYYGILLERIRRAGGETRRDEAALVGYPLPTQTGETVNVKLNPDEHA